MTDQLKPCPFCGSNAICMEHYNVTQMARGDGLPDDTCALPVKVAKCESK